MVILRLQMFIKINSFCFCTQRCGEQLFYSIGIKVQYYNCRIYLICVTMCIVELNRRYIFLQISFYIQYFQTNLCETAAMQKNAQKSFAYLLSKLRYK